MGLSACSPLGLSSSSFPFSVSRERSGWDASNVSSKLSVGSCRTNKHVYSYCDLRVKLNGHK